MFIKKKKKKGTNLTLSPLKLKNQQQTNMNIFILITSNISKGPDRLLADVLVGGCDQANKGRNGPAWHDSGRLLGRPGGDVSQSPGCFELDRRTVHISQEGDKLGDETSADQLVNGRMFVTRQQLPVFKTVHKSYCASSYVAFIYGKKKEKGWFL